MRRVILLARILICFLFIFLPLNDMDQWIYDHFFKLRGKIFSKPEIVLITIPEKKVAEIYGNKQITEEDSDELQDSQSIWYSDFYTPLLNKIQASSPKLVIFTSFFDGMRPRSAAAPNYKNTVFSSFINDENKVVIPLKALTRADNFGFNAVFPDPDNIVRKTNLLYSNGTSSPLAAYQILNAGKSIKRDLVQPLWIDFRGPEKSYPEWDALQILDSKTPIEQLKDKVVIIGKEIHPISELETPFGKMSRLEVQANAIDTFLEQREISILPRYVSIILSFVAVGFSVFAILYFSLTSGWLILLVSALFIFLGDLLCFSQGKIWIGIANPLLGILVTHLLMVGFKLNQEEEEQWRLKQEANYLKEVDQFKSNFISLFSHDLKTPIAKIQAIIDRLLQKKEEISHETAEGLKAIDKTNSELAKLIKDILKVTMMESMPFEPLKEAVDLNRLVEKATLRLKYQADEKKIKLILDLEPLFSIEGDENLILEVITNLLENAIKYSPTDTQVILRTREEYEKWVHFTIIDQGIGISADEIPKVLTKFYRGKEVESKTKGSGLGLYLAKYFVELHHGKFEIKSEFGKGTQVLFSLPIPRKVL